MATTIVFAVRSEVDGPEVARCRPGASSEIFSSTSSRMMSCSLTCGVSFISSATFSRCTFGKPKLPKPPKPAGARRAPAPPLRPSVLTGNGIRDPTEISPSSLFMIRMCGFDSTSTSLLVCSALMSTPNDGMSTVVVAAVAQAARLVGRQHRPEHAGQHRLAQRAAGKIVLAGLRPPTIRLGSLSPNRFSGLAPCHDAPSSRYLSSVTSRIIASTNTCLRGESSRSITRRSDW